MPKKKSSKTFNQSFLDQVANELEEIVAELRYGKQVCKQLLEIEDTKLEYKGQTKKHEIVVTISPLPKTK